MNQARRAALTSSAARRPGRGGNLSADGCTRWVGRTASVRFLLTKTTCRLCPLRQPRRLNWVRLLWWQPTSGAGCAPWQPLFLSSLLTRCCEFASVSARCSSASMAEWGAAAQVAADFRCRLRSMAAAFFCLLTARECVELGRGVLGALFECIVGEMVFLLLIRWNMLGGGWGGGGARCETGKEQGVARARLASRPSHALR